MEKKSLLQLLVERSADDGCDLRARNYAAFLAVRDEVAEAFSQGWSLKRIWRVLHEEGRVGFGYDAFLRYVRRWVWKTPAKGEAKPMETQADGVQGRVMPDWPKPDAGSGSKPAPNSYKGEMPVYGRKSRPEDFGKF